MATETEIDMEDDENYFGLDRDRLQRVIMAFLEGRGSRGASEEEISEIVTWANETYASYLLLQAVLDGDAYVKMSDGEAKFWQRSN